jgi:hypothetical protein
MPQSAFRNLVDTQYPIQNTNARGKRVKGTHLVAKAFLTYEEVLRQMEMNFCDEEANTFIAYLSAIKFPTRAEQIRRAYLKEKIAKAKAARYAKLHPLPTREEIAAANHINPEDYAKGPPRLWNGGNLEKLTEKTATEKKLLRVNEK